MEGLIGDIPWSIGYGSEEFGFVSLDDSYVGLSSISPDFIHRVKRRKEKRIGHI
jgi:hypothetical protein